MYKKLLLYEDVNNNNTSGFCILFSLPRFHGGNIVATNLQANSKHTNDIMAKSQ